LQFNFAEIISIGALSVSVASLYISFKNSTHNREIEFLKKKTELLSILSEEKLKLAKSIWNIEKANEISPNCYDQTIDERKGYLGFIGQAMDRIQYIYSKINAEKPKPSLKKLHELVPVIKEHQLSCTELLNSTKRMKEKCENCQDKEKFFSSIAEN